MCGNNNNNNNNEGNNSIIAQQAPSRRYSNTVWVRTIIGLTRVGIMEPADEIHYHARTWYKKIVSLSSKLDWQGWCLTSIHIGKVGAQSG